MSEHKATPGALPDIQTRFNTVLLSNRALLLTVRGLQSTEQRNKQQCRENVAAARRAAADNVLATLVRGIFGMALPVQDAQCVLPNGDVVTPFVHVDYDRIPDADISVYVTRPSLENHSLVHRNWAVVSTMEQYLDAIFDWERMEQNLAATTGIHPPSTNSAYAADDDFDDSDPFADE